MPPFLLRKFRFIALTSPLGEVSPKATEGL